MSIFVKRENLQIIWDVISMNNMFNETLITDSDKSVWFNSMIDIVKKKINSDLKVSDLNNVNRQTIKIMIANLKERYLKIRTDIASRPKQIMIGSELDTPYLRRQKEYDAMKSAYIPPPLDFRSIEDSPITNLSELVAKHQSERKETLDSISNEQTRSIEPTKSHNDTKISWATPLVEQESVIYSGSKNFDKRYESLERKIDVIEQKIESIFKLINLNLEQIRQRSKSI